MSDNIILIDVQATDNASAVISGVSNTLVASFKKVDEASSGVAASINAAIAPLSTSEAAQLRSAESLQLMASAQSDVASKQQALSSAINQYGVNSSQAASALRDLNASQNQLAVIAPAATDSIKQQSASFQDLIISVSGVATATFSLYSMYTNLEHSTLAVQKAKIQDAAATNNAEKAQKAYNDAVAKYGVNSAEALQKATDLGIATDRATLATERASMAEQNHTNALVGGALMVTPTLITMVSSLGKIRDMLRDSTILESISEGVSSIVKTAALGPTALLTAAQWQLNAALDANPVGIIILAIAGLVAAFIAAYTYLKPFRDAVNDVGSALMSALKNSVASMLWLCFPMVVGVGLANKL